MKVFGIKKKDEAGKSSKRAGPGPVPALVQGNLVSAWKMDPDLARLLWAVVRKPNEAGRPSSIRVYDAADAAARKVEAKDYSSLDDHPEVIAYEGTFDEASRRVELVERNKPPAEPPLLREDEIRAKVEALGQPGGTVFFYMARGSAHGGPSGMGAAVIEFNPSYPGKGQKKYNVRMADVVDLRPVGLGDKLWDSDKAKDIARWVKESQSKRMYSS